MAMTDWRGWKITDEQAELIRQGDKDARDKFYFDNLKRIRKMAFKYAERNPRCNNFAEDMIQGVYVDLVYFKAENGVPVTDGITLTRFVYSSFRFTPFGGLLYCSENNPKLLSGGGLRVYAPSVISFESALSKDDKDGKMLLLGDIIPAPDMFEKFDEQSIKIDRLVELCSPFLTPRNQEVIRYYLDGYSDTIAADKLNITANCFSTRKNRVFDTLRKHAAEILDVLEKLGLVVAFYRGITPYNPKTDRVYKLSAEKRAAAAKCRRERLACKKADNLPPSA